MRKSWESSHLKRALISQTAKRIRNNNSRFTRLNHPGRIKPGEQNTIFNAIRIYCENLEHKINSGKENIVVSNIIECNTYSVRKGQGCSRSSNRHLAKGAMLGVLIGRDYDEENDCKDYFFFETSDGVKKGAVPEKMWQGRKQDFKLLLNPDLIESAHFPKWVKFCAIDSFSPSIQKKTPQLEERKEPFNNKITGKESGVPLGHQLLPSEEEMEKVTTVKQSESREDFKSNHPDFLLAFAKLILDSYVKNLAAAMCATIAKKELERGFSAICRLLAPMNEQEMDGFTDRVLKTISHMRKWIHKNPRSFNNPGGRFVPMPSTWFDLRSKSNIKGAYENYLLPYQKTGEEIKKAQNNHFLIIDANEKAKLSPYFALSARLYRFLIQKYPKNETVRRANMDRWAIEFKRLIENDHAIEKEVENVITWVYTGKSKRARFWKNEAGQRGIRSASGIRRNYQTILSQYLNELESCKKKANRKIMKK